MPRKQKSPSGLFETFDGATIDAMLDSLRVEMEVSKADKALARLALFGLPSLVEFLEGEGLIEALTAIDPTLTLGELDEACSKLEDLAIHLLGSARECRHAVEAHAEMNGEAASAASVLGDEALEQIERFRELPILDEKEIAANTKLLRASGRPKHRA